MGPVRIDKVFDTGSGAVSLTLRRGGQEKRELLIVPGRYAAVLPSGVPHTEELSHLVRELRRWLSGSVIQEVTQSGGERYFEITLSRGTLPDALLLSAELFGTGNLLLARGGKLVVVAQPRTWAHRTIRVGSEYCTATNSQGPLDLQPRGPGIGPHALEDRPGEHPRGASGAGWARRRGAPGPRSAVRPGTGADGRSRGRREAPSRDQ